MKKITIRLRTIGLAYLLCGPLAWSGPLEMEEARPWVAKDRYGDFNIVSGESPSETVKFAASELQRYWERSTGHLPPVTATRVPGKVNVCLGREGNPFLSAEDVAGRPAFRGEIIVKFRGSVIGEAHIWAHVVMKAPAAVSGGVVVAAIESSVVREGLVVRGRITE